MPLQKADKKFTPHVALTGHNVNGGAANEHNVSCITKANMTITDELSILKRLGKATPEAVQKASYRNLQKQLEAALQEKTKPVGADYHWVWIQDFDESTVIFESGDTSYSIGFTVSEMGIVELSEEEEAVEVIRQDVYVKSDGSELILKGAEGVEKSVRNKEERLRSALKDKFNEDDQWSWVRDWDEDTIIFELGSENFSIGYTESEDEVVSLSEDEPRKIITEFNYKSEDGKDFILKSKTNTEDFKDSGNKTLTNNKEDIMSDPKVELTQEQIVEKAVQAALKAERDAVALEKALAETTEIVKGLSVEDSSAAILVKAFSENADLAEVVLKEFAAKDALVVAAQEEVVQVKAKFGDKEQVVDESNPAPVEKGLTRAEQMKANAQAQIASKNA